MESNKIHILVADDEILNLEIITEYLNEDYQISTANNGSEAWEMLEKTPEEFDIILLDRMMPKMDGMEVLEKIKQHPILLYCPVIFQTARASTDDIIEGIQAGAYYYLTKPFEEQLLLSVVKTAANDRCRYKEIQSKLELTKLTMGMLNSATFEFKTLDEARSIASLLSNACPTPSRIAMGLTELMVNAIEHGNLGISYEEKTILNDQGMWEKEVHKRLQLSINNTKVASIRFQREATSIDITIIDQGIGFDWQTHMDFAPERAMGNHGRGIAIANKLSFSSVEYIGKGNEVFARLLLNPEETG